MQSDNRMGSDPWLLCSLALLVLLLLGSLLASQFRGWVGTFGFSGLIFISAGTVGALLGFIFAVPRVAGKEPSEATTDNAKQKVLSTNTNLERISDWLATMLVGVGLSQLTNLNGGLLQFRNFLADAAPAFDANGQPSAGVLPAIGPFVLVLGVVSGFLSMYLVTRLVLVGFFRRSEDILSGTAVAAIRVAVTHAQQAFPSPPAELAAPLDPDAEVPEDYAVQERGATPTVSLAAAATFRRASEATTLSNDDALEIMFELLYEPGGYRRVIQMSGELSRTSIAQRPEYWFYLAAAFGQQMHDTKDGSDERSSARDNAMDAARRAVRLDKSFRARLWEISDPSGTDDDLALLRHDQDFRRLVGRN